MRRAWAVSLYCLVVGGSGWCWLLLTPLPAVPLVGLLLFGLVALLIDSLGFRLPPGDPHSLVGVILLAAALALGPPAGALIAASEGLLFGLLLPLIYGFPRNFSTLVNRPLLRSGLRVIGILSGVALASQVTTSAEGSDAAAFLLFSMILTYSSLLQLGRVGREYLQGGWIGVQTWWRTAWRLALSAEIVPLPLAALIAAIYTRLGAGYFLLASASLIAASAAVRRTGQRLQTQRRSVRELALLNEVSRAIIRSEQDVTALCELIYRETSKIVDTSSFHLGLFEGSHFTLIIRVQDRIRLPPLTVDLAGDDGLIGWMRQTGRALLVEDFVQEMERLPARPRYQSEHPPRAGIYVPLIAGERVIGSLSIQSYQPGAFNANDLRLLSLIADQAAVAITRARAFAETRQRANQLQAIHQVSEHITAILDLDELLPAVVQLIRAYFHYHPVHIFTTASDSNIITFRASTAQGPNLERLRALDLRTGKGLVGSAVASGQPVLVDDVRNDPRYIDDNLETRSELAVPLRVGEHILGVLDVQSAQPDDFDDDDLFIMRTLADQIAIAIDSANSYAAQQEEAWILNALFQVSENIGRATTLDELLPTLVRLLPLLVGCERCYCLLWDRGENCFKLMAAYGLPPAQRTELLGQCITLDAAPLLERMRRELRPVQLRHARNYPNELPHIILAASSGTLDILSLLARASLIGVLIIDYDALDRPTNPRQSTLYSGAIGQIARALESVLLSDEAAEAQRMEQELRVAREIQTSLLPAAPPHLPGWEIAADWRSARLVGGDFYDFWQLVQTRTNDERQTTNEVPQTEDEAPRTSDEAPRATPQPPTLGFVIADVSDKGVPAALFMALSRSLVRAAALDGSPPAHALERANRWITRDSESGMFVTLFYALLETATGTLRYTCAGHNPPLLYRPATRTFEELWTPGIALGVLEEIQLQEATVTLAPGDLLVCYTDGVTEAINEAIEPFDKARLCEVIARHHTASASELVTAITTAVASFTRGQVPFDDITLVVIKRAG